MKNTILILTLTLCLPIFASSTFILDIKNADGSLYWSESFNNRASLNKWLDEEKTRPYWKSGFTEKITRIIPKARVESQRGTTKKSLRLKQKSTDLTLSEINELLRD